MKKKVMLAVVLVLVFCMPVQAQNISTWIFGDSDAIGARVGFDIIDPNIEVGISALWLPDIERPIAYGIYAIYHLPEILEIPNPISLGFLPERISGHPYFGGKYDWDERFEQSAVSPIAGFVLADILFIEYQFESFDRTQIGESKLIMGIRIEF